MKKFSCIVPAFNEQELLPLTLPPLLSAIQSIKNMEGKLVVVDNNSSDQTAEIARQLGAIVIFEPINQIAKARNCGGNFSHEADYLVFIDADTFITPQLLQLALDSLDSGKICGGGCLVKLDSDKGKFVSWSWNLITKITNLAAGAFIFCLNSAFKETGGFNEKIYAAEDVFFSQQLKKWGKKNNRLKFRILKNLHIVTSDRKLHWYSSLQIIKMLTLIVLMPWRIKDKNKMNFWYERPKPKNNRELEKNNSQ